MLRIDIPWICQPRLNNHARAVAIRGLDRAILHLLQQAGRLDHIDYQTTRLKAIEADQFLRNTAALDHLGISVQHVQHVSWLESSALADRKSTRLNSSH